MSRLQANTYAVPGQPTEGTTRTTGTTIPFPAECRCWVVRVPQEFLDSRVSGLDDRLSGMLLRLESLCRSRCWTDVSNEELAVRSGLKGSAVQDVLRDLERAGYILRVVTAGGRRTRLGILLLKRSDADRPVADARVLADPVGYLVEQQADPAPRVGTRKTGCLAPGKPGAS